MARPRPMGFVVKRQKPFQGKEWLVYGYEGEKRKQYWFFTEDDAKADAADRNREREAYGSKVNLDAEARLEAFRGADKLKPHKKTISDAVQYYLDHLEKISASVPFADLAAKVRREFRRRLKENEVSRRHAESFENALRKLESIFGSRIVSQISANEVRDWLTGLPLAAKTRNKVRGYARQIFGMAIDLGYTTVNPVTGTKKFRERSSEENGEISILTSEETAKLFAAADPRVIPFLALHFFAGIRRATLERLNWSEIKMSEKRVIVPRYKGKNDKRYRITLSENLIEWLTPFVQESGTLLALSRAPQSRGKPSKKRTRDMVVAAAKKAGITLPDNAGRHTFISMHVAHHESIDKTALESDNSSEIIKSNYLDLVTREDAAKFWAIRP